MIVEEALEFVDNLVFLKTGEHLDKTQRIILHHLWEDEKRTYQDIANSRGYTEGHLKAVGAELWHLLSNVLGEKVSKSTFQGVLQKFRTSQQAAKLNYSDTSNKAAISISVAQVLHISDLQFGTTDNARTWYAQLAEDLRYELHCSRLDALIISGDIASKSTPDEYAAAQLFINRLSQEFQLESQQIIIVPGNHDVNWKLSEAAYTRFRRQDYIGQFDENDIIAIDEFIEVKNPEKYKERFANFSRFYEAIKGNIYPLDYAQQYSLQHLPEQNLLVLGLNSAWQIDHHYKVRASINAEAVSNALSLIRRNQIYEDCLKIVVWHHSLNSTFGDRITDNGVIERLATAGFRLVLHGGIHRDENNYYRYEYSSSGQQINIIGAGVFGASVQESGSSYPWQYNFLKIETSKLTVETRRRDEPHGVWKPDARWNLTSELNPLPHYVIFLTQDNADDPELYLERGQAYINSGRYEEAIASLDQAIEIKPDFYEAWLYRGEALANLGQIVEAIHDYEQALVITQEIGYRSEQASCLDNLGNAYNSLGQYQQAIDFYQQSLGIASEIGDRNSEGKSLANLGNAYNSLGQYQQAIGLFQQSFDIAREIGDRNGEGISLNNLGNVYNFLGQYQQAIDFYQQSLEISREIGDRNGEGNSLNNLGNAYVSLGQYQWAIEFHQQSLDIAREIGDRNSEGKSLANLGNAYGSLEEYQRAIEFHQQSLDIAKEIGDRSSEAISLSNLGNAYHSLKQYQQAIEYYQISLTIAREIGDRYGEMISLSNLGGAYLEAIQGDRAENIESAIAIYTSVLEICTRQSFPEQWAKTQNNLGLAFSERIRGDKAQNLNAAINYHQAALQVYTREAFPYKWADTRKNIGNAYIQKIHSNSLNNVECLDNIEYAILFYQDALEIYTPEQLTDECLSVRQKLSDAHYLLEHYQREEIEDTRLLQPITHNQPLARIELLIENLLDLEIDVIVRPTNTTFGFGGKLSQQILERVASTSNLFQVMANPPRLSIGEIFVTDAENLSARYLFHMPIDVNVNATEATVLQAMRAALNKAESLSDVRTIAFPSVGTGLANLNPDDLASKILKTVASHFQNGSRLEKVIFAFIDTRAYQAYVIARQMLVLETTVAYEVLITTSQIVTTVAREIELSINMRQVQTTEEGYLLQITQDEATGNELNIFLTAPGFQFNSDNTTSLPLDSDTININQTAIFNLTALRPGKTKIKAELYCGETYKTTLETEVEVTAFEETELRPLIAARSRPVPQPDIILQVRTTWNADISACTFNYHIDSYQPRLLFSDDVDYNSQSLSNTWVERSHSLLKTTLEEAANSLREDFRSRLVSLGQYLFYSLLPEELQNTFRTIASFNQPFTLLILADQDAWFPWELLHDGQKFLGDRFIIGRWLWELEKARPYEFPVGAVNVAHYASVEQPELWTELLHSSGAPPPIPIQAGIFNDITLFESIRGLHLIRYGQSVDTTNRQDAPVQVNSSSDIQDIEREVQPAKLSLRRNHPLVSLSYLNAGQPELTALEQTWASTFVRAGCSAFVGSLWAVQPNVEAAFVSAFYNSIWAGQTLGVAFQTACRLAKTVVPESLDWLAYVLFGDPMARPYRPVQGQGYAVVEPIGQEIDDPVSPGSTVRFRVSLRRTPPVWYENRLMEVAEDLTFDDLRVFIVTSGLHVTPSDSILMTRTATGDYLGWFTLTVPAEMETRSVLVQIYFEDGIEPVHNLRFALNIVKQDGEAQ